MSDREKAKQRMFLKYDMERNERDFQEVLAYKEKYITRPVQRIGIPRD